MPIPVLGEDGLLPVGVHDCTLGEIKARFGVFQQSDRRHRVRRRFGFDLFLAREGSPEAVRWVEFLQQVRLAPGKQKGILRVRL